MRRLILQVSPHVLDFTLSFIRPVARVDTMKAMPTGEWEVQVEAEGLPDGPPIKCRGFFFVNALDDQMGTCILFRMVPIMPDADEADGDIKVSEETVAMLSRLFGKAKRTKRK